MFSARIFEPLEFGHYILSENVVAILSCFVAH